MICYDTPKGRFSFRTVGILIHEGKLLVHRIPDEDSPFFFLPGGRVEFGEEAAQALVREMLEETGAVMRVERPVFLVESFFPSHGVIRHELGFYFLLFCEDSALFARGERFELMEDGVTFEFSWLPLQELSSQKPCPLFPSFLKERLLDLPQNLEHIILRNT